MSRAKAIATTEISTAMPRPRLIHSPAPRECFEPDKLVKVLSMMTDKRLDNVEFVSYARDGYQFHIIFKHSEEIAPVRGRRGDKIMPQDRL